MFRKVPPVWFCALLLVLALCWRMIGAPVTAKQFADLKTPLLQAQIQLPSRMGRILRLWQPSAAAKMEETFF